MPADVYEIRDGERLPLAPTGDAPPNAAGQVDAPGGSGTGAPDAPQTPPAEGSAPPASSAGPTSPASGENAGDPDDADAPDETPITAGYVNRRIGRLVKQREDARRDLEAERAENRLRQTQLQGQVELLTRMLSGQAPTPPETTPPGPPRAEDFVTQEAYEQAREAHVVQQAVQAVQTQTRAQAQQAAQQQAQQQLIDRERAFREAHPDFDRVVQAGLVGKTAPHVQQALMLLPDGPALAYTLATQPDLLTRLNTLHPALMLAELGRLAPPAAPATHGAPAATTGTPQVRDVPPLPPPIAPLSGASATATPGTYREGMSAEEYRQWRKRTSGLEVWKNR